MPWTSKEDLPPAFKGLPDGAKSLALAAGNDAIKDGKSDEEAVIAMWGAVKNEYKQSGDKWVLKESVMDKSAKGTFHSTWLESVGGIEYFETAVEGEEPQRTLRVTLIEEGFSDNVHESRRGEQYRRYYPAYSIEQAAGLAEGLPVYIGNATDHTGVKTLRDKAGVLRNVELAEVGGKKAIRGDLKVFKHQGWLLDMAKDDINAFGPSIEAGGQVKCPAKVNGRSAAIVESIDELRAALLVENPAAGGAVHNVYESKSSGGERMRLDELTEAERNELKEEFRPIFEAEIDVKAKDTEIKELTEAGETKDKKIKELEDQMTESESVKLVEAAFPKTKVKDEKGVEVEVEVFTEATQIRLKEELKGETDEAKIEEAVKAAVEEVKGILEAKGIKAGAAVNVGGTKDDTTDDKSKHLTEAEKNIKAGFGIEEEKTEDNKEKT